MKKLLTIVGMLIANGVWGQVATLEHSYSSGSYSVELLEDEGYKYVIMDGTGMVRAYNLDHSLFKEINTGLSGIINRPFYVIYHSKYLFNSDPKVEILITVSNSGNSNAHIVNEDGAILQTFNGASTCQIRNVGPKAVLLINKTGSSTTDVYGLYGKYAGMKPEKSLTAETDIYPNPVDAAGTITYTLPAGQKQAHLKIYSASGVLVKQMVVTDQFKDVLIYRGELPPGSYVYEIAGKTKQFIIN